MKTVKISSDKNYHHVDLPGYYAMLFSYETLVAVFVPGEGYYVTRSYYSNSTSKHINKFVGTGTKIPIGQEELESLLHVTHKSQEEE